ncbi:MAG: hypothetical protein B7X59_11890 [Polaromonas sp. 39-63-203]|jgi:ElaB/YqjD/DUF883 family membrane-anchored ribosome-binding protein|uniref:DUF883 family protein n=1 Tax=Polaromonas sp. TaxID=1869339 RepID=UPI000BCDAB33|nr:hypothetical protein [Polaromonas sp.]OYY50464.1 MAG: hypothetical protein B7Y54_12260 [Polaromonas sp. 35-63-240]OYY91449.1 MAG: hypothetical protein B7Y42_13165 [Polaromonas sp. 28-63-22]OYZ80785.1 MAG: hypothetical protein B7Y03_12545 [Polaromonas sp. 24-62-144]OZA95339.1 MAG: hypothetical protein B7X59_11890 [Polaromonas sp. 39-63-203]HQS30964.1 hypothetical protein [Polaromonas sp.]
MDNTSGYAGSNPDANPAPNPVSGSVDSAGAALHTTIEKMARPAHSTVDRVSTAAHETVDKLASRVNHVADRFSDQTRLVTEAPSRAVEFSKSWVQDKPLEAVGVALAIGFILGRLTAR